MQNHQENRVTGHQTRRLTVNTGMLSVTMPTNMDSMATDPRSFILNTANQLVEKAVTEYINIDSIETNPAQQTQEEKEIKIRHVLEILTEAKKDINNLFEKIETMKKLSLY